MEAIERSKVPHAVCLPFPLQGHINPIMKFALLLHHKGFHITFVHTEYNHRRLGPAVVEGSQSPGFQFRTIPDGLQPADATRDAQSLCLSTRVNCLRPFTQLIHDLNREAAPQVTCVVTDSMMTFGLQAAKEIGVLGVVFRTSGACSLMCYKHIKDLVGKGLVPFKDETCFTNAYLETPIDWVPGMIPLRLKDFPSFIQTTDPDDPMLNFIMTQIDRASNAEVLISNTFDELEGRVLDALSAMCPSIFTIGPLQMLVNQLPNSKLAWVNSSLLKQDSDCLKWLDSRQPSSVIYVNFGSITVLTKEQMSEFAWGLVESKKNFLWTVRPDLVRGENSALEAEYWEEAGDRGYVTSWCAQEQVLDHPAVGGFLTHCGWNSVMESLCSGVPMLCWPFFADQHLNCKYLCEEWGVGMEIKNEVKRDELGFVVKELVDGERGKMMRKKAVEWKTKAASAVAPGGSSYMNLERLVKQVLTV